MAIAVPPDIYIPGVRQSWAGTYGWSLNGGPRKFILHSTETDSAPGCVDQLCHYLDGWANPHVVWDPWTGDMAMCGRADWAEGALVAGNKDGSVVLQVEAVGRAGVEGSRPFMDSPMLGWDKILAWADSWGIPRVFPAGLPLPYPQAYGPGSPRDPNIWANQSGYYGHSQVPQNDHGDPGLVDLAKIFPGSTDWFDMATVKDLQDAVRSVLNEGTGGGQKNWATTNQAMLSTIQGLTNQLKTVVGALNIVISGGNGHPGLQDLHDMLAAAAANPAQIDMAALETTVNTAIKAAFAKAAA